MSALASIKRVVAASRAEVGAAASVSRHRDDKYAHICEDAMVVVVSAVLAWLGSSGPDQYSYHRKKGGVGEIQYRLDLA